MNSQQIGERITKIPQGGTMSQELEIAQALWVIAQQLDLMNERQK